MANPIKGEVGFDAGGKKYRLSYSTNALCELEAKIGKGVPEISAIMGTPEFKMSMLKAVVWAGLTDHHGDLDDGEVSSILKHQYAHETMAMISKAFELAFPVQSGDDRPPEAAPPGNGAGSSVHGNL